MSQVIFVTGAGGFIGQSLLRSLRTVGSVKVLTRRALPEATAQTGQLQQILGDLLDPQTYEAELAGCDVVVHLAAATGRAARSDYERVNVEGTRTLLRCCKAARVPRFLHISTIAATYADQRYYPYATTKAQAEILVQESGLDFAILRPTLVLGASSPIWATLQRIAKLPVVPLPEGGRPVCVQPIHVDDLVRGVKLLLERGVLGREVLELGGPRPLSIGEFLRLTQERLRRKPARLVRVPLAPIRMLLAALEPVAGRLLPITAGQLALFANQSTAAENWLLARLRADMPSTEETIASLLDAPGEHNGGGGTAPRRVRQTSPMSHTTKHALLRECDLFTDYLVGAAPSAYVAEQYSRAANVHGLSHDEDFSCFDRATLTLARRGSILARCTDAYCAIFHRRGVLRRKLIVLAAIVEHVSPTSQAFDRVDARHAALTVLSLAAYGSMATASLLLGTFLLLPARLACWLSTRLNRPRVQGKLVQ